MRGADHRAVILHSILSPALLHPLQLLLRRHASPQLPPCFCLFPKSSVYTGTSGVRALEFAPLPPTAVGSANHQRLRCSLASSTTGQTSKLLDVQVLPPAMLQNDARALLGLGHFLPTHLAHKRLEHRRHVRSCQSTCLYVARVVRVGYPPAFLRAHLALARVAVYHVLLVGHQDNRRQRTAAFVDLQMQVEKRLQFLYKRRDTKG
jgi:hypothetical protein